MAKRAHQRGFTITEILVVIGVIVLLSGILLAALTAVKSSGQLAESMNRMRQIALFMRSYSTDNREYILPSQFDYSNNAYPGKVRSGEVAYGEKNEGTWADILWTTNELGVFADPNDVAAPDYRYDSPDAPLYEKLGTFDENPLRSSVANSRPTRRFNGTDLPTPFGPGAQEAGEPGYFAANNFFDSRDPNATNAADQGNGLFVTGQIRAPARSLYLIDSVAGETISTELESWDMTLTLTCGGASGPNTETGEVDFRYNNVCLILYLDGHVEPENAFDDLEELQGDPTTPEDPGRGCRVTELTKR